MPQLLEGGAFGECADFAVKELSNKPAGSQKGITPSDIPISSS
jgi:hypothetical protein